MTLRFPAPPCQIHATAVAISGNALLITGASGSGKSGLALHLMAFGAALIADDRCDISLRNGRLYVDRPTALPQAIEAWGLGIIETPCAGAHPVVAVLNMDRTSEDRMPAPNHCGFGDVHATLIENSPARHFPAAVFHYVRHVNSQGPAQSDE